MMQLTIVLASLSLNPAQAPVKQNKIKKQAQTQSVKQQEQQENDCSICLATLVPKEQFKIPCSAQHAFHKACVLQWFKTAKNQSGAPSCPLCREKFLDHQAKFFNAVKKNDVKKAEALLPFIDINALDDAGDHALFIATRRGHSVMVNHLLQWNADPDTETKHGETALQEAAFRSRDIIMQLLLDHRASVHQTAPGGDTALHYAAIEGDLDCVQALVKAGASGYLPNNRGETPIDLAVAKNHTLIVAVLFKSPLHVPAA